MVNWWPQSWFTVQFCFLQRNYAYERKISIYFIDICSKPYSAYFLHLIQVYLHVVVWPVWLMLHNFAPAFACLIIFTCLPFDHRRQIQPVTPSQIQEWNTKKKCGICSKLTIKTLERHQYFLMFSCQWGGFNVLVNFEQISHLVLEFILLSLNRKIPAEYILIWTFVCI